ncbi:unnamed protein product [Echinostoma caproni]|uniref:BUB1 N-terminal domain-containing protein n=1 Tax=Echinostoma caproni TaxID=27848 RepID=A0A183A705_9TREM|nr:unnamed protein product [Echinostoma caproni]
MGWTEYCAQPSELFELLFRQGVGTMCAKFYVTWAKELESHGALAKTAAVYAHGLRAGARPISWLEDRTESFLSRYSARSTKSDELDSCFTDGPSSANSAGRSLTSTEPARQQLAALRLVETGIDENAANRTLKVPAVRTSEAWHPHQSGLEARNSTVRPTANQFDSGLGRRPCPRIVPSAPRTADPVESAGPFLHTLAPIPRSDSSHNPTSSIRPLSKPSQWLKENCPKPGPWKNEKVGKSS